MSQPIATSRSQIACTFASLALFDDDVEITSENISKLLQAAGVNVETYWPQLFANAIKEKGGVIKLIQSVNQSQTSAESKIDESEDTSNNNGNDEDTNIIKSSSPSPAPLGIFDSDNDSDSDTDSDSDVEPDDESDND
eukprot:UN01877